MNEAEARAVLLEDELRQARATVEFLHWCLASPDTTVYAFPDQTLAHLAHWDAMLPRIPAPCYHAHSGHPDCPSCVDDRARQTLRREAKDTLGIPYRPGEW